MVRTEYVCPALNPLRNDISSRWCEAELLSLSSLVVPAGFVHSPEERALTKRNYGEFLTGSAVEALYVDNGARHHGIRCLFQTDSGFDQTGYRPSVLRWHEPEWVHRYVRMLAEIAECIGIWPDRIEIHPGKRTMTYRELAGAMVQIRKEFHEMSGKKPDLLLENIPQSPIHSGASLDHFWKELTTRFPSHVPGCGIALDVSGLFIAARRHRVSPISSLFAVPPEALRGFHIHQAGHAVVPGDNQGFWRELKTIARELENPVYVLPEVHTRDDLVRTLAFCREYLFGEVTQAAHGYPRRALHR